VNSYDIFKSLQSKFLSGCRAFSIDPRRQPVAAYKFEFGLANGYLDKEVVTIAKEIVETDEDELYWVYRFTDKAIELALL
jgi:hypothetical protein